MDIPSPVQTKNFCRIAVKAQEAIPVLPILLLSGLWRQLYVHHQSAIVDGFGISILESEGIGANQ